MSTSTEFPAAAAVPAVEVEDLRKTYPGGTDAVKGIDFTVGAGEVFGLTELIDRPVSSFSGGQRRRLEIARALVSRPATGTE
jgi:ABC-type multidrug transport system ATPase subunit